MATYKYLRGFKMLEQDYWWFLALEDVALYKGLIKRTLDPYQTIGGSPLSGGTHTKGGAIDCYQSANPTELVRIARYGGGAAWYRHPGQGFSKHIHVGIKGLGSKPYNYQITALEKGYNGLGYGGFGGLDDGPRSGLFPLVSWEQGLERLRNMAKKGEPKFQPTKQTLPDFFNGWLAVDRWDPENPDNATLTGLSDDALHRHLVKHGFTFYSHGDLHKNLRYALADFVTGQAESLGDNPDYNALGWNTLLRVIGPADTNVTWVELRPVFDAAHAGGSFGSWGKDRVTHSVRAAQSGINHYGNVGGKGLLHEDGIYGPETRKAVARWQIAFRGAQPNTPASDGVPGVHDYLHLVKACSERVGRPHRARFLF